MNLVNLTPHGVTLLAADGRAISVPPSGVVARLTTTRERVASVTVEGAEIPVYAVRVGALTGLPEPEPGVRYIVSRLVADAVGRADLLVPDLIERDAAGAVIGAAGFALPGAITQ